MSVLLDAQLPKMIEAHTLRGMGGLNLSALKTLLLSTLPTHLRLQIDAVQVDVTGVVVQLISMARKADCPCCQQPSRRVHSSYTRRLSDVPCGDYTVRLCLQVRKFFCDNPLCARSIYLLSACLDSLSPMPVEPGGSIHG